MKNYSVDELIQIFKQLDTIRQSWNTTLEECAQYTNPSRLGYISRYGPAQKKTLFLYDAIGIQVLEDLSNYLSSTQTPAASEWFDMEWHDPELKNDKESMEWLEDSVKRMRSQFNNSNFQSATAEVHKDLVAGTACDEILEKKDLFDNYDGIHFGFVHMREMAGLENQWGVIDMTFRFYIDTTAKQWYERFGDDAGESVTRAMENNRPGTKIKFLHVVYPRDAGDVSKAALAFEDAPETELPFASVWINFQSKELVKESGYYEPSRNISRWNANADNIYGHGPALNALPDIRTLNESKRLQLEAFEKNIDPPLKSSIDDETTDMNIGAGGNSFLRNMDSLQPLHEGSKWDLVLLKDQEIRHSIERTFFVDLIREPLGDSGPQKTMYEVARRLERAQRILGEASGRIRQERLKWVVERVYSIMFRNDQFLEPPEKVRGQAMNVVFTSPLAIAQSTQGLEGMRNALTDLAAVAEVMSPQDPGQWPGWHWFDEDGYVKEVFEKWHVPATITNDEDKVKDIRQKIVEQMQAAQAAEQAEQLAGAVQKVGAGAGEGAAQDMVTQIGAGAGGG